jgi:protein TonB
MIGLRGIAVSTMGHLAVAGWLITSATSMPRPVEDMSAADQSITVSLALDEAAQAPEDAPPPAVEKQVEAPLVDEIPEEVASVTLPEPEPTPLVVEPDPAPPAPVSQSPSPDPDIIVPVREVAPALAAPPKREPQKLAALDPTPILDAAKPNPVAVPIEKIKPKLAQKKSDPPARKAAGDGKGSSKPKPASAGSAGGKPSGSGGEAQSRSYAAMILARLRGNRQTPAGASTGRVILSFTISASGGLVSVSASGGDDSLKSAVLGMVRNAAPFPAMPEGMSRPRMNFTVPIQFN